jgi:hypothetical protein
VGGVSITTKAFGRYYDKPPRTSNLQSWEQKSMTNPDVIKLYACGISQFLLFQIYILATSGHFTVGSVTSAVRGTSGEIINCN